MQDPSSEYNHARQMIRMLEEGQAEGRDVFEILQEIKEVTDLLVLRLECRLDQIEAAIRDL